MESAAMTVVLRCNRPDREIRGRTSRSSQVGVAFACCCELPAIGWCTLVFMRGVFSLITSENTSVPVPR